MDSNIIKMKTNKNKVKNKRLNSKGVEKGIIYGWYNTKNEKWYIGQTINPEARFQSHIISNDGTKFHNALRKYGLNNFVYCVIENNVLAENLNMREQYWIDYYDSYEDGYNMKVKGKPYKVYEYNLSNELTNIYPSLYKASIKLGYISVLKLKRICLNKEIYNNHIYSFEIL